MGEQGAAGADLQEGSSGSDDGSASGDSDAEVQKTTSSDVDTKKRADAKPRKSESSKKHDPIWDVKAFGKKCRPLQCQSIWDMPTSRIPDPVIEPVKVVELPAPACSNGRSTAKASNDKGERQVQAAATSRTSQQQRNLRIVAATLTVLLVGAIIV